jgi:hypothetical protein
MYNHLEHCHNYLRITLLFILTTSYESACVWRIAQSFHVLVGSTLHALNFLIIFDIKATPTHHYDFILKQFFFKNQANLITKFLKIAKKCYEWSNFSTAFSIYDGLQEITVRNLRACSFGREVVFFKWIARSKCHHENWRQNFRWKNSTLTQIWNKTFGKSRCLQIKANRRTKQR